VTDAPGARTPEPDGPAPLRTEPRPLVVHWLVDSAVLFLATIIVALFVGVSWWAVLVFSLVVGGAGSAGEAVEPPGVACSDGLLGLGIHPGDVA
jgi:hypothetical protein